MLWAHPVLAVEYDDNQGGIDVNVILKSMIRTTSGSGCHLLY